MEKRQGILLFSIVLAIFYTSCQMGIKHEAIFKNAKIHEKKPYVLLISIDGYRHDYTTKYVPPNITKFIQKGISSQGLIPIYPSKTFPNHYSIVTGLRAENHGIVANSFWDDSRRQAYRMGHPSSIQDGSWYGGEPLWVATTKEQMVSASYFWVGSEANIQGIQPTYWYPYSRDVPNLERIKQVLSWFQLPYETRPHFITLYFSNVDGAGHRYGTDSDGLKKEILSLDKDLGYLFDHLAKIDLDINVILLSDHGMKTVGQGKTIFLTDYITLDPRIRVEGRGTNFLFYISDHTLKENVYKTLKKVPHFKVYRRGDLPAKYGYNNSHLIGDLVLAVDHPYYMKITRPIVAVGMDKKGGTHGYDPFVYKDMQGIFYAQGPQIIKKKTTIPAFENIHVYPFIMDILGLKVKTKIDGNRNILAPYLAKRKTTNTISKTKRKSLESTLSSQQL